MTDAADRESFKLRRLIMPFYLPSFLWAAGAGAILPVLPLYIRSLGAELSLVGVVMAMFALGALIGNVPGSIVIARLGKRRAMIAAVAAEVLLAVGAALVGNPYQLMPILFALGVVHTLFFVARQAYFRDLVPAERADARFRCWAEKLAWARLPDRYSEAFSRTRSGCEPRSCFWRASV